MINVRELRIGNRILVDGCEYEVTGILKQEGEGHQINAINIKKKKLLIYLRMSVIQLS